MATVTIAARTRIQRITEATAITIIETIRKITAMETAPSIRRMAVIIRGIRKIVRKILTREIRTIPRSVPVRTGRTKIARHRISDSWIPVRLLAVFWRLCRMALVLSEATIICRENNDVYVSPSQIRRFNLKTGDIISGNTRIKAPQEKFCALMYVQTVNDLLPFIASKRQNFENMTPIFPNERLRMEREGHHMAMRIVDLVSPVGKGQRGMIVSPPKAGKTTLLKEMAQSIVHNNPEMHIIILLIDERPEEVTDIRESIVGDNVEVIYSTFDEQPEHHKRVAEMVIERSKRLVEHNKDVTILLDSITRLARAYNMVVPPSGRTLSGGLDPGALHMPKKFFGAARNMREGGSLTILATALVDTGSKMDDVIYEEFKGTGNMELILDRKLSEKRVFPAIDIVRSGTRREDLLLTAEEKEAVDIMRKQLNGMKPEDAVENILNTFAKTKSNEEFIQIVRKQKFI